MLLVPWALIGGERYPSGTPRNALLVFTVSALTGLTIQRLLGEVRQTRDFTAGILDTAGSLVIVTDRDARDRALQPRGRAAHGFAAEDVVGRLADRDAAAAGVRRRGARRAGRTPAPDEFPRPYEHGLVTASGEGVWSPGR